MILLAKISGGMLTLAILFLFFSVIAYDVRQKSSVWRNLQDVSSYSFGLAASAGALACFVWLANL